MKHLDYSKVISFETKNIKTPELLFRQKASEIEKATQNYVLGNIAEYTGEIESYDQAGTIASLTRVLTMPLIHRDIQDELGELGEKKYKFEFFLSSPILIDYKFRILFFEYGIGGYPLTIVLEQGIADEINQKEDSDYIIKIETERDLEKAIITILNTKRIISILQKIIDASSIIGTTITVD